MLGVSHRDPRQRSILSTLRKTVRIRIWTPFVCHEKSMDTIVSIGRSDGWGSLFGEGLRQKMITFYRGRMSSNFSVNLLKVNGFWITSSQPLPKRRRCSRRGLSRCGKPVPLPISLVVTNGAKMRLCVCWSMPAPVSVTVILT